MRREAQSWVMAVVLGFALVACATNAPLINARSHSNRDGVFSEVIGEGAILKGTPIWKSMHRSRPVRKGTFSLSHGIPSRENRATRSF